jgi:hypothetical protein
VSRSIRFAIFAGAFFLLASVEAHADNCGSRFDCYKTQAAGLAAAIGASLFAGFMEIATQLTISMEEEEEKQRKERERIEGPPLVGSVGGIRG